ncbi:nucleoside-diphosphate sugar epimerase [Shewanella psychrotolerans]|uniref:nucleoside-diphosphate sugar epimerase n=1 Tax=Shewanella psychrotolerans TaxID=2864206 RepID=UPI001C654D82|nr:nucleoside-diphosphate sugar epimerase [Shewanella psychrotolerans]QYK00413.1 nucleoside-diphosphate sugar epimerase [Shewanella psychrotolerans]
MNAAIIGATGLVGKQLLRRLVADERYQNVWVLGRRAPTFDDPKLVFQSIELDTLEQLTCPFPIDHGFCCLGTTMKQAGSKAAFCAVDQDAVIQFTQLCNASKTAVITALGADANSRVFYNKIKGETELKLTTWALEQAKALLLVQPSLLLGQRSHSRILEDIGQYLMPVIAPLMLGHLAQYRPIKAEIVAEAMLFTLHKMEPKTISTLNNLKMLNMKL